MKLPDRIANRISRELATLPYRIGLRLYAPARLVLETLSDCWTPGTVVMFDEFWFRNDELCALRDYGRQHGRSYRLVVGRGASRVAIQWQ